MCLVWYKHWWAAVIRKAALAVDRLTFAFLLKVFNTAERWVVYLFKVAQVHHKKLLCYYQRYLGAMLGVLILLIISYEAGTIYGKEQRVRVSCHIYYVTNLKENKHNEPAVWPCASPPHKRLQSFLFSLFSDLSSPRPKKFNIWVVGRAKSTAEAVFTS